jgi:hypothetical protein
MNIIGGWGIGRNAQHPLTAKPAFLNNSVGIGMWSEAVAKLDLSRLFTKIHIVNPIPYAYRRK